jgi:hypothetical protein
MLSVLAGLQSNLDAASTKLTDAGPP